MVSYRLKKMPVLNSRNSSPSASQQFEGRGADDINNQLTLSMDRLFNGPQSGIDVSSLCIIPGQQCWVIYIDAMVRYLMILYMHVLIECLLGHGLWW